MVGIHTNAGFIETASKGGAVAMQGATSVTPGTSGSVPAPSAGDNSKFLRGDGSWASPGTSDAHVEDGTLYL